MIGSVKGFYDILPESASKWRIVEEVSRKVLESFGFFEIRIPLVEKVELFQRSIGATTDIVEKEMYTFSDRKGESLTLRPEGTASIVRAYIEHNLYHEDPVSKLYYMGPMFRYERPQKGRARQFYQIGAEVLGVDDPKLDAEILDMLTLIFNCLDIEDCELMINSLGCEVCRPLYRDKLLSYIRERANMLCKDCMRRLEVNPLRVLDCKNRTCQDVTSSAPFMIDFLCSDCDGHFKRVKEYIEVLGVPYMVNPKMVRGLDYYTKTAFEVINERLGSQNAVAAGGRYDRLVKELGGPDIPGFGFAIGVERATLLIKDKEVYGPYPDTYIIPLGDNASKESLRLLKELRAEGILTELSYGERSIKSHMRRADKMKVEYVIIIGDDEIKRGKFTIKYMKDGYQQEVSMEEIVPFLKERLFTRKSIVREGMT